MSVQRLKRIWYQNFVSHHSVVLSSLRWQIIYLCVSCLEQCSTSSTAHGKNDVSPRIYICHPPFSSLKQMVWGSQDTGKGPMQFIQMSQDKNRRETIITCCCSLLWKDFLELRWVETRQGQARIPIVTSNPHKVPWGTFVPGWAAYILEGFAFVVCLVQDLFGFWWLRFY